MHTLPPPISFALWLAAVACLLTASCLTGPTDPQAPSIDPAIVGFTFSTWVDCDTKMGPSHSVEYAGGGRVRITSCSVCTGAPVVCDTNNRALAATEQAFVNGHFTDDYLSSCDSVRRPGPDDPIFADGGSRFASITTRTRTYAWSAVAGDYLPAAVESLLTFGTIQ